MLQTPKPTTVDICGIFCHGTTLSILRTVEAGFVAGQA